MTALAIAVLGLNAAGTAAGKSLTATRNASFRPLSTVRQGVINLDEVRHLQVRESTLEESFL
jgi:hypothetical protein